MDEPTQTTSAYIDPLVSIVIPTYNGAQYIIATLESALDQTYANKEVIVIDDGSTDNTAEILSHFQSRIRYIKKPNGGPASARNRGIQESKGEWLAFLDGDDLWQIDKLEKQMRFARNNPHCGLIHTNVRTIDPNNAVIKHNTNKRAPVGRVFEKLFARNHIATSSVLVKKNLLTEHGLFDERTDFISVEDYDMWLRVVAHTQVGFLDDPLLLYRIHPRGISKNTIRSYVGERKVLQKNLALFQDRFPQIQETFDKRIAAVYEDCGDEYFYLGDHALARREYMKALQLNTRDASNWFKYLKTLIPVGIISRFRKR